jgi:hypothetical protein
MTMSDRERRLREQLALGQRLAFLVTDSKAQQVIEAYRAELESELRQLTTAQQNQVKASK